MSKIMTKELPTNGKRTLVFVSSNLLGPKFAPTINWKTGIFSATVAAFIIESYKMLPPDSGDQTAFLLG